MRRALLLLILSLTLACTETDNNFPSWPVYLELDLGYEDKALNAVLAYKIYTKDKVNQAVERTGFGGVLVYHGVDNNGGSPFYAFDAACPNEVSQQAILTVDETSTHAVCPKCGSRFELTYGLGTPMPGNASKAHLHRYTVRMSGNKIYVTN